MVEGNSPAQVSTVLYAGPDARARWRRARTSASVIPRQVGQLPVGEAQPLHPPQRERSSRIVDRRPVRPPTRRSASSSSANWSRNQGSMPVRSAISSTETPACERPLDLEDPLRRRRAERRRDRLDRRRRRAGRRPACAPRPSPARSISSAAEALLERLLERAADRHHLADRLHLGGEAWGRRSGTSRRRSAAPSPRRSRAPARSEAGVVLVMSLGSSSSR